MRIGQNVCFRSGDNSDGLFFKNGTKLHDDPQREHCVDNVKKEDAGFYQFKKNEGSGRFLTCCLSVVGSGLAAHQFFFTYFPLTHSVSFFFPPAR